MEVREEVRQLARPLAEESGFELVDVEIGVQGRARAVRVLLDKPGGITVGDCAGFSRRLSDCLEMNQTLPGSYRLEVSSPGIERPLTTLEAVQRYAGSRAAIVLRAPRDGRRKFEGELLEPDAGSIGIKDEDGHTNRFEWDDVKSARLVVDPWAEVRQRREAQRPRGGGR